MKGGDKFNSISMRMSYQAVPEEPELKELEMMENANSNKSTTPESVTLVPSKDTCTLTMVLIIAAFVLLSLATMLSFYGMDLAASANEAAAGAAFDAENRYIMRNFDLLKPMANFLPGLAGIWGVPLWAFYVNRGQGITSFGRQSKDGAIMRFVTAEKAYQQTPFNGFRTFLKGKRVTGSFHHMPFFPRPAAPSSLHESMQRDMKVGMNDVELEERVPELGLQTNVHYLVAPQQTFPALIRTVTFTNTDPYLDLELDVLDGLGRLEPNGLSNYVLDAMGRTMEAWMNVYNVHDAPSSGGAVTMPFFHISQGTADTALVQVVQDGYFSLAYLQEVPDSQNPSPDTHLDADGLRTLLPFIVDPNVVYGFDTTLTSARRFFASNTSLDAFLTQTQGTTSRTPCAFAGAALRLRPRQKVQLVSVYGYAENLDSLIQSLAPQIRRPAYTQTKSTQASELVQGITQKVHTETGAAVFDLYVQQNFLDNVLRGGLPQNLGHNKSHVFHVYSRIHGDIERDYNYFVLETSFFSQGPGNFRDVNQNRRLDVFHSPAVKDFNLRLFLSLIQADGYNPLTVASPVFKIYPNDAPTIDRLLSQLRVRDLRLPLHTDSSGDTASSSGSSERADTVVRQLLQRAGWRPGTFFAVCAQQGVGFELAQEQVVHLLMDHAVQDFAAKFDQNGFWTDHWTYTLDLLESYLQIYPDEEVRVLFDGEPVPFFLSPAAVLPRSQRYSVHPLTTQQQTHADSSSTSSSEEEVQGVLRSYSPIYAPPSRQEALNEIYTDPLYLVDEAGAGGVWQRTRLHNSSEDEPEQERDPATVLYQHSLLRRVFRVSAFTKLLMLGVLKFAALDPLGMGVDMEGGKPGWNDAMNGLPGLLGSGMPETYEMLRVLRTLRRVLSLPEVVRRGGVSGVPAEFESLLRAVEDALTAFDKKPADFEYWDATHTALESYRDQVLASFSGDTVTLTAEPLAQLLDRMVRKTEQGIARALQTTATGLTPTYFYYDCTQFNQSSDGITAQGFTLRTLPLFLEGPARQLKVLDTVEARREVYTLVKQSPLYDSALQMYTLCESLQQMGQEVGRMKAFSPGWLENQSVWLHMSYKYYLELLRGGLYEEFFAEMKVGLVPFMEHLRYGRSPLEAASFIVSSAFPDKTLHGSSFLARLSGSTAEFLSMWALMFAGPSPFSADPESGELSLTLRPVLPAWLFDAASHEASFTFLGSVQVTYVNPQGLDSWKTEPRTVEVIRSSGERYAQTDSAVLRGPLAEEVRRGLVKSIRISF